MKFNFLWIHPYNRFNTLLMNSRNHQTWASEKIRSSYISFFKSNDHQFITSSPVVPWNDSSIEFVNAGMNQFKSIFVGKKNAELARATNSQKCIRVGGKHNDLSIVGKDTYHHTFFEMLGNWSFNDYFKKGACELSWELLTNVFKIPKHHLYVTYFGGDLNLGLPADEECKEIWLSLGIPESRVLPFGLKENFWEMGDTGPCGPCTEIHYEKNPSSHGSRKLNKNYEDLIEIWNIVFIQYLREQTGNLISLEKHYVDTGMGLERITACLNDKSSNYDTDIFMPLFDKIQKMSGSRPYAGKFSYNDDCLDTNYRILSDHSRMIAFALADGLLPHDSYSLRKAIRRCIMIGRKYFGLTSQNFLAEIVEEVTKKFSPFYHELSEHFNRTKLLLDYEDESWSEMMNLLSQDWSKLIEAYPKLSQFTDITPKSLEALKYILPKIDKNSQVLSFEEAKILSEKYFLNNDSISDIAQIFDLKFDVTNFKIKLQENSRSMHLSSFKTNRSSGADSSHIKLLSKKLVENEIPTTDHSPIYDYKLLDKKYLYPDHETKILSILKNESLSNEIHKKENGVLILKSSNFFPKSGGQSCDNGIVSDANDNTFKVTKVVALNDYIFHFGEVLDGSLEVDQNVILKVNQNLRLEASKSHTAHHLFMAALQHVSGTCFQRVSTVSSKGFLVDCFIHPNLELEKVILAEKIVQNWIEKDRYVNRQTCSIFDAINKNKASLVSGEKYPDEVTVISSENDDFRELPDFLKEYWKKSNGMNNESNSSELDDLCRGVSDQVSSENITLGPGLASRKIISNELCCGTHLYKTGIILDFALTEFKSCGHGVSRFSAVFGAEAAKRNIYAKEVIEELNSWEAKLYSMLEKSERVRESYDTFKKWQKEWMKKSKLPATAYYIMEQRCDKLITKVEDELLPKSNWSDIKKEFDDYLSSQVNDNDNTRSNKRLSSHKEASLVNDFGLSDFRPIFYRMNTDYRGPLEHLKTIAEGSGNTPCAFVCKGWGRIRLCVHLPVDNSGKSIPLAPSGSKSSNFPESTAKINDDIGIANIVSADTLKENVFEQITTAFKTEFNEGMVKKMNENVTIFYLTGVKREKIEDIINKLLEICKEPICRFDNIRRKNFLVQSITST